MRYPRSGPFDGSAARGGPRHSRTSDLIERRSPGRHMGRLATRLGRASAGEQLLDRERAVAQELQSRLLAQLVGQLASCPGCKQRLRPMVGHRSGSSTPLSQSERLLSKTSAQAPGQMLADERCGCPVDSGCPRRLRAGRVAGGDHRAWSQRGVRRGIRRRPGRAPTSPGLGPRPLLGS